MQAQDTKVLGSPCSTVLTRPLGKQMIEDELKMVVIEEDQDGNPGLRTSP